MPRAPIAVFYEHPDWFRPLFTELERKTSRSSASPAERVPPISAVARPRITPSQSCASAVYRHEISRAGQLERLDALGLGDPRARVIDHARRGSALTRPRRGQRRHVRRAADHVLLNMLDIRPTSRPARTAPATRVGA